MEYGEEHWRAEVARARCSSLDRTIKALERLRSAWSEIVPIMGS